jgi:hypothetical protein
LEYKQITTKLKYKKNCNLKYPDKSQRKSLKFYR